VIEDLKELREAGVLWYQPLIRAYIGQGLRTDLTCLERPETGRFGKSLRRHGVKSDVISAVLGEAARRSGLDRGLPVSGGSPTSLTRQLTPGRLTSARMFRRIARVCTSVEKAKSWNQNRCNRCFGRGQCVPLYRMRSNR